MLQTIDGRTLTRVHVPGRGDCYVMRGATGTHTLTVSTTPTPRLTAHWAGFCGKQPTSAFEKALRKALTQVRYGPQGDPPWLTEEDHDGVRHTARETLQPVTVGGALVGWVVREFHGCTDPGNAENSRRVMLVGLRWEPVNRAHALDDETSIRFEWDLLLYPDRRRALSDFKAEIAKALAA